MSEPHISRHALSSLLPDFSTVAGHKYGVLAAALRALILDGRVAVGTRLPSERELAAELQLSRASVTAAYDRLRQDGHLVSRTGAGSFVTLPAEPVPARGVDDFPGVWRPVGETIDLTLAALPAPPGTVTDALASVSAELPSHVYNGNGYHIHGLPVLREAVAARFTARGIPTSTEQILITGGALHGLDLLLRLLAGPGDRVLTELPTYPGALDAIRASAGRLLPVPLAPAGGWDVTQITSVLRQSSPKLAYLIPDFQNPTGVLVDDRAREAVLSVARQTATTVIVDETFAGLGFAGPAGQATPAAAIDGSVVTLGSLSKSVWGGLRIGWVRGPAELIQRLAALRAAVDLGGPLLEQLVATELIGRLDTILAARAQELERKRDALLRALDSFLPEWRPRHPDGGMALWIELDAPVSTPLTLLARAAGVNLVPGPRFGVDGTLERFLRLPYTLHPDLLREAVVRLAGAWHRLDRTAPPLGHQLVA